MRWGDGRSYVGMYNLSWSRTIDLGLILDMINSYLLSNYLFNLLRV